MMTQMTGAAENSKKRQPFAEIVTRLCGLRAVTQEEFLLNP
jgi:hypothetical protein